MITVSAIKHTRKQHQKIAEKNCPPGVKLYQGIPLNTELCSAAKKQKLYEEIEMGKYEIGELVVPIKFSKLTVKDGKLIREEFTVEGRKSPLDVIRKNLYKRNKPYYRIQANDVDNWSSESCIQYLNSINEFDAEYVSNIGRKSALQEYERF